MVIYIFQVRIAIFKIILFNKGGILVEQDFNNYKAIVHKDRLMVKINDDLRAYLPPPPSLSVLITFVLRMMNGFDLKHEDSMSNEERVLFYHRLLETYRHTYAKRPEFGDENFIT